MRQSSGYALLALAALVGAGCSTDDPMGSGARQGASGPADGTPEVGDGSAPGPGAADPTATAGTDFDNRAAPVGSAGTSAPAEPLTPIGEGCAGADVSTSRVVPTVLFVIDGSGSMDDDFNGPSRWEALRSTLMDPEGIVPTLEGSVEFGMVLYHGPGDGFLGTLFGGGQACPGMAIIDPALNNFSLMDQNYPAAPLGGSTPTHTALDFVMNNLAGIEQVNVEEALGPQYVVLATDGQPNDNCPGGSGGSSMPQVVQAAQLGADKGIKMFVISLAPANNEFQAHLDELATIGGTGHPPFSPQTKDELANVLIQVIGGAVGCQIALNGTVTPGNECLGYVDINGNRLECDSDNGWRLVDERTFELTGQACEDFLSSPEALLHADFPCDVFTPE